MLQFLMLKTNQMMLPNKNPTKLKSWKKLIDHFNLISNISIKSHFENELNRDDFSFINWEDFHIDVSKNRWNKETFELLINLSKEAGLEEAIEKYFSGYRINVTEDRPVLHTALRSNSVNEIKVDGENIQTKINAIKTKMYSFCEQVISGKHKGYSGKKITDIVNIGIGGSDLGPAMVSEALEFYKTRLNTKFISNIDGDHVSETIKNLNPETTLFIIVSKTFTTQETLNNALKIKQWFLKNTPPDSINKHFVAVSTNINKIKEFGISSENIFPMNDWVGGRFSLWSSVGLSICLSIGPENFNQLLKGAGSLDNHFRETPFEKNIPIILGLLSIWYNNFHNAESEAIIPYSQYLRSFPAYLQQGIMESNGKSIDRNGDKVDYQTGNIIWGSSGTNAQHAFFQLIHQGTKLIPTDFIGFKKSLHGDDTHHKKLMSNFIAQTEALMNGKNINTVVSELKFKDLKENEIQNLAPFKTFEGNKPTNTILIEKLTPYNLGALISIYEHKIFVQGIIWNIYSFDQWGVELGKQLADVILNDFSSERSLNHDFSTNTLINKLK